MTALAQLAWDCKSITGMEKLVLMGWLEQVPDGSDIACASKETVAEFLGISKSTVKRHTKALVKNGVLVHTDGRQLWKTGWTPIYQVNVELLAGKGGQIEPPVRLNGGQFDPQGYRYRSFSVSQSVSQSLCGSKNKSESSCSTQSVEEKVEDLKPKTENLEPTPTPSPIPTSHGQKRVKACPNCNEPWTRDANHICKDLDEFGMDAIRVKPIDPNPDFDRVEYSGETLPPLSPEEKRAWTAGNEVFRLGLEASRKRMQTVGQKSAESIKTERTPKPTPTPTPSYDRCVCGAVVSRLDFDCDFDRCDTCKRNSVVVPNPPVPQPPQSAEDPFPDDIWDARGRTKNTPAGRAWAASRGETIETDSINP
ncbi:MAG: helix-turn-helix domain-containing protein [Terriglobales bacterium]|jgi:hypothetical protein